jgi:hypothetical protein
MGTLLILDEFEEPTLELIQKIRDHKFVFQWRWDATTLGRNLITVKYTELLHPREMRKLFWDQANFDIKTSAKAWADYRRAKAAKQKKYISLIIPSRFSHIFDDATIEQLPNGMCKVSY